MKSAAPSQTRFSLHRLAILTFLFLTTVLVGSAAQAAILTIDSVTIQSPQQVATVCADLAGQGDVVAGVQNDLVWDDQCMAPTGRCRANPAHGKTLSSNQLSSTTLRALLLSLSDVDPIPDGELYCCDFLTKISDPGHCCTLRAQNARASDPHGRALPLPTRDGKVCLGGGRAGGPANELVPDRRTREAPERAPEQAAAPPREELPPARESAPQAAAEPPGEAAERPAPPERPTGPHREVAEGLGIARTEPQPTLRAAGETPPAAHEPAAATAPAAEAKTAVPSAAAPVTRTEPAKQTPSSRPTRARPAAPRPSPQRKDFGCRITAPGAGTVFPMPLFLLGLAFAWTGRWAAKRRTRRHTAATLRARKRSVCR